MQDHPLAVIVRFHDERRLAELDRCIFSLCCQYYRPITLYLITQRFSDESVATVRARIAPLFLRSDAPKLVLVNFTEATPLDARAVLLNLGTRVADERFLAFLDYDDAIYPEAYTLLVRQLLTRGASIAFGGISCKYSQVSPYGQYVYAKKHLFRGQTLIDLFRTNFCPIHSFVIDRLNVAASDMVFDEHLTCLEDYAFLLRFCARYRSDFAHLPTIIGDYYFKDDGSNTVVLETDASKNRQLLWRHSSAYLDYQKRRITLSATVADSISVGAFAVLPTISQVLDWHDKQERTGANDHSGVVAPFVAAGHFYSPIVDPDSLSSDICSKIPDELNGIRLSIEDMEAIWVKMLPHMTSMPFHDRKTGHFRYFFDNGMYEFGDAAIYYAFIKELRPSRVIEIGSGFSSALLLDTLELEHRRDVDITFIEPYPNTLNSLLLKEDLCRIRILRHPVQEVPLEEFARLRECDILFIDSTHVLKTGSDVAFELFEILPVLKPGVRIHFHDMFFPFEYPKPWVLQDNRSWNELYAVRAFLMYNARFRVEFFSTYLVQMRPELILHTLPRMLESPGGNMWLVVE